MKYTLPNENGNPYDFGDPEFWEAYGADPDGAELFSQGFPEYWKSVAGWYASKAQIDEAAERMRRQAFDRLPSMKKTPFLFSSKRNKGKTLRFDTNHLNKVLPKEKAAELDEAAVQSKRIPGVNYIVKDMDLSGLIGHKPETKDTSWNEPIETGPFKYLEEGTQGLKEYSEASVPLKYWYAIGRTYVDALRQNGSRPSPLPSGIKRRERLEDGALFRGRARCGDQRIIATNANVESEKCVRWGPALYDFEKATKRHFLAVGGARSGKTSLLKLLIQSLYRECCARTVIYDFNSDLIPFLTPTGGTFFEDYYLLHPYDARGVAWDIAKDVDENTAKTLATVLIPASGNKEKDYFKRITRNALSTIVRALIAKAGNEWAFLDLMLAIREENIRPVLSETLSGRRFYNTNIKGVGQTQQNVLSELDDCSDNFIRIAAAWSRAKVKLSLREWVANDDKKSIVLGHSSEHSASIKPVIKCILHYLTKAFLNHKEKPCHTFMILDEFSRLGPLEELHDLMEAAPSQGLSLVLGVHDLGTVKTHYGQGANGLLGACNFQAFLRPQGPETAQWISGHIGQQDVTYEMSSQTESVTKSDYGSDSEEDRLTSGSSTSNSVQYVTRPAVPAELIMHLPLAGPETGIQGYFVGPGHTAYRGSISKRVYENSGDDDTIRNRGDGVSVDDYVLWVPPEDGDADVGYVENLKENFKPPEDSFETLEKLGFTFDPTSHSHPLPLPERRARVVPSTEAGDANRDGPVVPSVEDTESNIGAAESFNKGPSGETESEKRYNISDYVWDDELENFRLKTEED